MICLFLINVFPFSLNIYYLLCSSFYMLNSCFYYTVSEYRIQFESKPHLNYRQMIKPLKCKNENPIKADWQCCVSNQNSFKIPRQVNFRQLNHPYRTVLQDLDTHNQFQLASISGPAGFSPKWVVLGKSGRSHFYAKRSWYEKIPDKNLKRNIKFVFRKGYVRYYASEFCSSSKKDRFTY